MKNQNNHIQIYNDAFGIYPGDYRPSELSNAPGVDIHHIECKGMGGNPSGNLDRIENLMALTREEHMYFGDKKKYMSFLLKKHFEALVRANVNFDHRYLLDKIHHYEIVKQGL